MREHPIQRVPYLIVVGDREVAELATASGAGPATIRRYEMQEGIPAGNTLTLVSIKSALESAGIEFTGDPLVNPGVTLRIKRDD